MSSQITMKKTTFEESEVSKFDKLSEEWWEPNGKFKLLHDINPLRISYIKDQIYKFHKPSSADNSLENLKLLDIGCGGGLVSVPLYLLKANVTGIDASSNNIKIARNYSERKGYNINYITGTIENLAIEQHNKYDVILALEVIEHVNDFKFFLSQIAALSKPGGIVIISTINRTIKSLITAKFGAEYILRLLPVGTHNWSKFLKPSMIEEELINYGFNRMNLSGMIYKLSKLAWQLSDNTNVNYFITFKNRDD